MEHSVEPELDLYEQRTDVGRNNLILRVESTPGASGDWEYRASYPELRGVSATAPKVLQAILDAETELSRHLSGESA